MNVCDPDLLKLAVVCVTLIVIVLIAGVAWVLGRQ